MVDTSWLPLVVVLSLLLWACGGDEMAPQAGVDASATALPADPPRPNDQGLDSLQDPTDQDPTDQDPTGQSTIGVPSEVAPPPDTSAPPIDPSTAVDQIVAAMSVEQKVGQLFTATVIGDDATEVSESAATANLSLYGVATPAEVVRRYHLGGVAYFDHDQGPGTSNVADLQRTATLSQGLQQAVVSDTGIGLLIGTDQEGGPVVRLNAPFTVFPAAREIGDSGEVALAEQAGQVTGIEAQAVGVNWIYAPDADVNVNPDNPVIGDRAFGTTADRVVPFVLATAQGLADAGVLPTLKHFPGHGDTAIDSHTSLPTIDHDRATLDTVDLPPFAVAADLSQQGSAVSVMVGHLAVPAVDPSGVPATISPTILSLLRDDLAFDGLVVTDAMNMGALDGFGDSGSLAVQAINAGIDMVLMPSDLPLAWNAVAQAVAEGEISAARLDQAVTRILQAKDSVGVLDAGAINPGDMSAIGSPSHGQVLADIKQACGC